MGKPMPSASPAAATYKLAVEFRASVHPRPRGDREEGNLAQAPVFGQAGHLGKKNAALKHHPTGGAQV